MPDETLDEWLMQRIEAADINARQSRRFAPNSYGDGFDNGVLVALKEVQEKMVELWSDVGKPISDS